MRSFASDNNSGVHPLVMEALNRANSDHAVGYGDDPWTEEAVCKIREAFTPDCEPLFVFNGTHVFGGIQEIITWNKKSMEVMCVYV